MNSLITIYLSLTIWQYPVLFLITAIEGPLAIILAGFLIAQGTINIYLVFPLLIVADLFGDSVYYLLGRYGRDFGLKFFKFKTERLKNIEDHFRNHGGKTLLLGKLAHGVGAIFLFVAGMSRMPYGKFIFYNLIGSLPKSAILIIIGYFFGHSLPLIHKYLDYFGLVIAVLFLLIILIYIKISKIINKKNGL